MCSRLEAWWLSKGSPMAEVVGQLTYLQLTHSTLWCHFTPIGKQRTLNAIQMITSYPIAIVFVYPKLISHTCYHELSQNTLGGQILLRYSSRRTWEQQMQLRPRVRSHIYIESDSPSFRSLNVGRWVKSPRQEIIGSLSWKIKSPSEKIHRY